MKLKAIAAFCIIYVFSGAYLISLSAQDNQAGYKIENLSSQSGVSQNLIFTVFQDTKGFIWYGTMFGLVRYDGVNFVTFRYNPADTNSLSNDDVISIYEDRSGYIWVGTYRGGLNRYDRKSGLFARYIHSSNRNSISDNTVWTIYQDKFSALWFGTEEGLNSFENNLFRVYKYDSLNNGSIGSNKIYAITEDRNSNLWIGTGFGGLNKYDRDKDSFTRFKRDSADANSIGGNFIRSLCIDDDGIIWIGTLGKGLNSMDPATGRFTHFTANESDEFSLPNNNVFSIAGDTGGRIWAATGGGLCTINKNTGRFTRYSLELHRSTGQPENVISICRDNSGVIWASLYNKGLFKLWKEPSNFVTFKHEDGKPESLGGGEILSVYEDSQGKMWAGTSEGLNMYDEKENKFRSFVNKNAPPSHQVNAISELNSEVLLLGTNSGLYTFDKTENTFNSYAPPFHVSGTLLKENITKLYTARDKSIWAGTSGSGLIRLAINEGRFEEYINTPGDTGSLSENLILSIFEDKDGYIWAGTFSGLNKLDIKTGMFVHYKQNPYDPASLSNSYTFSMAEDAAGNLWIGTGGGLNMLDKKTGTLTYFTEKNGLPNSVICGLEFDNAGFLWMSTHKGISRFNVIDRTFKNYDINDGLGSNLFATGIYTKRRNGNIIFGTAESLNEINPQAMQESKFNPPIVLTSFSGFRDNTKEERDITGTGSLELSYSNNVVELNYASLDFTNPGKIQYAFMLEGFNTDWQYAGSSTKAVFTNLSPGSYTFKVKGTNSDGVWSTNTAVLNVVITPPFWKTWWFYILVFIAGTLLIAAIQNYRIRHRVRSLLQLEIARETEREKVREQASRDYHDELGHKLTRISLYSRKIKKRLGLVSSELSADLEEIVNTSNSLQVSAKDLIWSLSPQEDTLFDLAVRLRDFGNSMFENTDIIFSMPDVPESYKDVKLTMNNKRHIIYIFKEGMNNILKYAECTEVKLDIVYRDSNAEITLQDNGIGFDCSNESKGYGLKNIAVRTKQINGKVNIESVKNKGTTIRLMAAV